MGIWDMIPFIVAIPIIAILAELVKFLVKTRAKAKTVSKDELAKLRDAISTMRTDLDEIKADLRTVVLQMDDLKFYKTGSSVIDKKD